MSGRITCAYIERRELVLAAAGFSLALMDGAAGPAKAVPGRFDSALAPTKAVTRGLDPRVHPLRIELFTKKMACRVIRAFTPVFAGYARQ
jgi:hypothetical protein